MNRPVILSLLLAVALIPCSHARAQASFDVPGEVTLNVKEDYSKYETDIINAAKWLEETDLDKEVDKRQRVNAFVVKWVSGSPTVTVSIDEPLMKIVGGNPALLSIYVASYSRSVLENKASPSTFLAVKAGLLSVVKVYKKGIGVMRNRQLDKLARMDQDSQIEDYILNMLKAQKA